jgi:hypothetical protein
MGDEESLIYSLRVSARVIALVRIMRDIFSS